MNARSRHHPEHESEGGARPVSDLPPDQPKRARGPIFLLIAIVGALLIFAPIAWGFITIVAAGAALSTTTKFLFWAIWGICLLAFVWIVIALWRRAA